MSASVLSKGPKFGARHVQILLMASVGALGFCTNSVLSVTIVAMVDNTTSPNPNVPAYDWNNTSVIVSAILWSGVPVNLLAGYLGKQYGPKWFVFGSSLLNSVFFMLIPLAAHYGGSTGVIVCRIFQGIPFGFLFPLNSVVMGRWVPPDERSRLGFVSSGLTTVAVMIAYISAGFIASSHWGWTWVFYILGVINFAWSFVYAILGEQSASVHKRISPEERRYLQDTLFDTQTKVRTPWCKICKSMPFWAIVVGQTGASWLIVIMSTEMSIFLARVMQFDMKMNGIVSAAPSLVGLGSGIFLAILSDLIPKRGILSIVNSRRTFHLTGMIGVSLSLILTTLVPVEHRAWAIVLLCICNVFTMTTAVGGASTNVLDVSPKNAGIIMGFSQMLSQCVSLFAPLTVHWMCHDKTDASQWRKVFLVSAAVSISTAIFFVIFATDKRQNWEAESDQEAEIEVKKV